MHPSITCLQRGPWPVMANSRLLRMFHLVLECDRWTPFSHAVYPFLCFVSFFFLFRKPLLLLLPKLASVALNLVINDRCPNLVCLAVANVPTFESRQLQ